MNLVRYFLWYKVGIEYWIPIGDIVIPYDFQLNSPGSYKFYMKEQKFKETGKLGKIKLNKDFILQDGYISYLLCKKYDLDKVPVWFVD